MKNRIMLNPQSELPLKDDTSNLFLKIMIAVTVFLFVLAFAGQMLIQKASDGWSRGISGTMTVQIKPSDEPLTAEEENLRVNKVIQYFEKHTAVEKVSLVSDKQMKRLLGPWLGQNVELSTLPLPKLIDVRLKNGMTPDFEAMSTELAQIAPYTSIDNHRVWLSRLLEFAGALRLLAVSVLTLVLLCSAFSIFYATQTSLGLHSRIIEILHIIGATDDYIAKQYARRSFWTGLIAGIAGLVAACGAMYLIGRIAAGLDAGILATPSLTMEDWLIIASLPLWAAVLSMLTAYGTVKRVLGKIM